MNVQPLGYITLAKNGPPNLIRIGRGSWLQRERERQRQRQQQKQNQKQTSSSTRVQFLINLRPTSLDNGSPVEFA